MIKNPFILMYRNWYLGNSDVPVISSAATLNHEHRLDREGNSLELPSADTVVENSLHQWGWRDPTGNGSTRNDKF